MLVLATLGVYLGLLLAGATPPVWEKERSDNEIKINKQPLADFANKVNIKDLDPSVPFLVEYELLFAGKRKLDAGKLNFIQPLSGF